MSNMQANHDGEAEEIVFGRAPVQAEQSTAAATRGFRGVLSGLGIKMRPSTAEIAQKLREAASIENQTTIRQATWTRAVSVLVANPKGGSGKTPTSLCLADCLAAIRGNVVVVEVSDDPGKLLFRSEHELTPALGLGELVRDVESIATAGQLAGYTAPQTTRAHVVGSLDRRTALDGTAVRCVVAKLDEFYSVRVMDSGNQYTSSAFVAALEATDVLVIPIMGAGDSATDARLLLDELHERGGHAADLARNAVVVRLVDGRTEHETVLVDVERMLDLYKIEHRLTIPYDQHIGDRGQITFDLLSEDTKDAFTALAATVVRQLQQAVAPVLSRRPRGPHRSAAPVELVTSLPTGPVDPEPAPARDTIVEQAATVECPDCGAEQAVSARFCSVCGRQISGDLASIFTSAAASSSYAEGTTPINSPLDRPVASGKGNS